MRALDVVDGAAENRQVREAQEVHLEQADLGDLRHRELRRRDRRFVAARRALQRHDLNERIARDDDARGVRAGVARDAFEPLGGVDEAAHLGIDFVRAGELG